jgi:hypothetical protein
VAERTRGEPLLSEVLRLLGDDPTQCVYFDCVRDGDEVQFGIIGFMVPNTLHDSRDQLGAIRVALESLSDVYGSAFAIDYPWSGVQKPAITLGEYLNCNPAGGTDHGVGQDGAH